MMDPLERVRKGCLEQNFVASVTAPSLASLASRTLNDAGAGLSCQNSIISSARHVSWKHRLGASHARKIFSSLDSLSLNSTERRASASKSNVVYYHWAPGT